MATADNTRLYPGNVGRSLATHVTEEKLLRTYTSTKGWKTRKLETIRHMTQKTAISFDLTSYNEIKKEITSTWEKIMTMRDVTDQLMVIKSDILRVV